MKIYTRKPKKKNVQWIPLSTKFSLRIRQHQTIYHTYYCTYTIFQKIGYRLFSGYMERAIPILKMPMYILLVHNKINTQILKSILWDCAHIPYDIRILIQKCIIKDLQAHKEKYKFHILNLWRSRESLYVNPDEKEIAIIREEQADDFLNIRPL